MDVKKWLYTCECGNVLDYAITPFMTLERRVCKCCGRLHYVDDTPISFATLFAGKEQDNDNRRS